MPSLIFMTFRLVSNITSIRPLEVCVTVAISLKYVSLHQRKKERAKNRGRIKLNKQKHNCEGVKYNTNFTFCRLTRTSQSVNICMLHYLMLIVILKMLPNIK